MSQAHVSLFIIHERLGLASLYGRSQERLRWFLSKQVAILRDLLFVHATVFIFERERSHISRPILMLTVWSRWRAIHQSRAASHGRDHGHRSMKLLVTCFTYRLTLTLTDMQLSLREVNIIVNTTLLSDLPILWALSLKQFLGDRRRRRFRVLDNARSLFTLAAGGSLQWAITWGCSRHGRDIGVRRGRTFSLVLAARSRVRLLHKGC